MKTGMKFPRKSKRGKKISVIARDVLTGDEVTVLDAHREHYIDMIKRGIIEIKDGKLYFISYI